MKPVLVLHVIPSVCSSPAPIQAAHPGVFSPVWSEQDAVRHSSQIQVIRVKEGNFLKFVSFWVFFYCTCGCQCEVWWCCCWPGAGVCDVEQAGQSVLSSSVDHHPGCFSWAAAAGGAHISAVQGRMGWLRTQPNILQLLLTFQLNHIKTHWDQELFHKADLAKRDSSTRHSGQDKWTTKLNIKNI